jgi:hypothetical protein
MGICMTNFKVCGKKAVVAYFNALTWNSPKVTKENYGKPQSGWSATDRNSNHVTPNGNQTPYLYVTFLGER